MLHKTLFSINESPFFEGYTDGDHWNGWACPYFTKSEANKLMEWGNEQNGEEPMSYDETTDTYICYRMDDLEPDTWQGYDIETEDGTQHIYDIGAYSWVWDDMQERFDSVEDFVYYYLREYTDLWDIELETAYEDITERCFAVTGTPKIIDVPKYVEDYLNR